MYSIADTLAAHFDAVVLSTFAATVARPQRIIVPDVGFFEELNLLSTTFGSKNVILVHVIQDGCTFINDPRDYVDHPAIDSVTMTYENLSLSLGLMAFLFFELNPA